MKTIIRFEPLLDGYLVMDMGDIFLIDKKDINELLKDIDDPSIIIRNEHPLNSYSVPTRVQIQVTPFCNLACKTCGIPTMKNKINKPMTGEFIQNLLSGLQKIGVLGIEWSGGEPLSLKNFFTIADTAHELGFNQSILTNGININQDVIKYLEKYFFHIQISMDDVTENYDDIVGRKAWDKFVKSIETLTPEILSRVTIATVFQQRNSKNIGKVVDFCKQYGINSLRLSLQVPIGRSSEINWESYSKIIDDFRVRWSEIKADAESNGIKISCFLNKPIVSDNIKSDINAIISPGGFSLLYIDAYGDIFPFPFLSTEEFYIGSVYKDSIEEIWIKSTTLNELRKISYDSFGCGKCKAECSFAERSLVYGYTGDINSKPMPNQECLLKLF